MKDYPQHTIETKPPSWGVQKEMDEIVARNGLESQEILRLRLHILVAVAQKEQMIEDHKLYMGAIKE